MIDKMFVRQLEQVHGELETLTYEDVVQVMDLLKSEDEEIALTGQSILYLSNFFAIPYTCKYILTQYSKRDGDFKTLAKILPAINDPITEYDEQILNKLKDGTGSR